ncbi:hypothetical protein GCM10009775_04610 [Microbacterium aoyamense]|uniref:Uncharacterized protein n=1 Tax=Microbacterium aoyamense TaxID=344166 RepID=A0ABN2P8E0_9MICO|nr:hypothetical protein [Microbacterium aoyamense]
MITPLSLDDVETATDAEIIAAFIQDGETEDSARAHLAVIRGQLPADTTVD